MTDPTGVVRDDGGAVIDYTWDEDDECDDIWHLVEYTATDACPTCGYRVGGDEDELTAPKDSGE